MKYKKFLLIPILLFLYVFFIVDFLVNYNPAIITQTPTTMPSGGQEIGIGEAITVEVTRPYFFGLFRLPVYTNSIGYIGHYHQAFFYFIGILVVIFVIMEWKQSMKRNTKQNIRGEHKMARKTRAKDLLKAFVYGGVFGFVVYLLSGDTGVSVGLAMLLMYLEYKLQ